MAIKEHPTYSRKVLESVRRLRFQVEDNKGPFWTETWEDVERVLDALNIAPEIESEYIHEHCPRCASKCFAGVGGPYSAEVICVECGHIWRQA